MSDIVERRKALGIDSPDNRVLEGDELNWLCRQIVAYPDRVDERFTTNHRYLRQCAALTMDAQASRIAHLEQQQRALVEALSDCKEVLDYVDDPIEDFMLSVNSVRVKAMEALQAMKGASYER